MTKYIDEEKEISGDTDTAELETTGEVETEVKTEPPAQEESPSEFEIKEDGKVRVGKEEFASVDVALKSFSDLRSFSGRQTTELGELRKNVEPEKAPEYGDIDVYDQDSIIDAMKKVVHNEAPGVYQNILQSVQEKQHFDKLKEDNPTMTENDWTEVARFGDERGVRRFDDALTLMRMETNLKQANVNGRAEALAELSKDAGLPPVSKGASGGKQRDSDYYDNLSTEEWAALPDEERTSALQL